MELKKELDQMVSALVVRMEDEEDVEQKSNLLLYAFCEMILTASQVNKSELSEVANIYSRIHLIPPAKHLDNFEETLASLNVRLSDGKNFNLRERGEIVALAMDIASEGDDKYAKAEPLIEYFRKKRKQL